MKKIGWILGCVLLLGMGSHALAQERGDADLRHNWDLRLGFFVPERSGPRAAEGDVWLALGAERDFYRADRWRGTISIDYYGSGTIYNIPITLNARGASHRFRYGAGAGIGISHDLTEGKTGFAYNLLAGYTLIEGSNPLAFDIRYHYLSTGGGQLNGWGFYLNYHF